MSPRALAEVPAAPGGVPLLGHAPALWLRPLDVMLSLRATGDVVRVDLGRAPVYFLTRYDLVHQVLVVQARSFGRSGIFERARPLLGDGLATSDGETHRRHRRLLQPAFHAERVASRSAIMSGNALRLARSWRPGQLIGLNGALYGLLLSTVAEAMFSADIGRDAVAEVRRSMPAFVRGLLFRTLAPAWPAWVPIAPGRGCDRAAARLRAAIDLAVERYLQGGVHHGDLLSTMLAARDPETGETLTGRQVRDQAITVLLTGTETTATTLAWALHELARNPESEARLHAEVDAVLGPRPAGAADVAALAYTRRVLAETMRLHPALFFMRRAVSAARLGGIAIPPGTELAYSPYALQRDPDRYPRPSEFEPDRHTREPGDPAWAPHLAPFGAGPHRCIGEAFAWSEMTIALATIAARWRLRPAAGRAVREVAAAIPRPSPVPMVAIPRRPPDERWACPER